MVVLAQFGSCSFNINAYNWPIQLTNNLSELSMLYKDLATYSRWPLQHFACKTSLCNISYCRTRTCRSGPELQWTNLWCHRRKWLSLAYICSPENGLSDCHKTVHAKKRTPRPEALLLRSSRIVFPIRLFNRLYTRLWICMWCFVCFFFFFTVLAGCACVGGSCFLLKNPLLVSSGPAAARWHHWLLFGMKIYALFQIIWQWK